MSPWEIHESRMTFSIGFRIQASQVTKNHEDKQPYIFAIQQQLKQWLRCHKKLILMSSAFWRREISIVQNKCALQELIKVLI